MKIKNNLTKIKINNIYFYDVGNIMSGIIHKETKTVKVLSIKNRINASPLATVQSVETKEIFNTDIGHLQLNPEYLKRKYQKLMHFYNKNNPKMIFKYLFETSNKDKKYIIIGNDYEINCLRALDKYGIVWSFSYHWFKDLDLKINEKYARYEKDMSQEYGY